MRIWKKIDIYSIILLVKCLKELHMNVISKLDTEGIKVGIRYYGGLSTVYCTN